MLLPLNLSAAPPLAPRLSSPLLLLLPLLALLPRASLAATELALQAPLADALAVCNDGSRAAFYLRPSPANASAAARATFVVFLESGGWCFDADTCSRRSAAQTSSGALAPTLKLAGLFDAPDARLRDATLAYAPYCSSDAWVGARAGPAFNASEQNATGVAPFAGGFRGAAIVRAVVAAVIAATGGAAAAPGATFLFAGFSAGGRGAMFNCDAVAAQVAAAAGGGGGGGASFACMFDSALWIDRPTYKPELFSAAQRTQLAYALYNASATVAANSPACAAAYPGGEGWRCIFGEYALPFVATPSWFLNMFLYDSYQLDSIAGLGSAPPWNKAKDAFAEGFRARMAEVLAAVLPPSAASPAAVAVAGARGGVFPACYSHGNTLSAKFAWQQVGDADAGGSATLAGAIASWLFGDATTPLRTLDAAAGADVNPFCSEAAPSRDVTLTVDVEGLPLNTVDDHFLGVNIDTGSLFHNLSFTADPDFARLAALLAPAQLRVGGGAADAMLFARDGPAGAGPNVFAAAGLNGQVTNVNADSWRALEGFARATGLSLLWDANGLAFREGVAWGAYNASGDVPPQTKACAACAHDAPFVANNTNLTGWLDLVAAEGSCVDGVSIG